MSYKIIVDSCGELTKEMQASKHFISVPLSIEVDGTHVIDDESFDQAAFLQLTAQSKNCPKSSCPSPEKYMESFRGEEENIYAVTLSAELSGSYNSAVLGKNLYKEEYGEKNIYVFNSRSASVAETLIAQKIEECEKAGMTFEQVIDIVEAYIKEANTYFVLESLDTLRKNGRLKGIKAIVATALNIKPVMGANQAGEICQRGQARGIKKALAKLVDEVVSDVRHPEQKCLAISHCNCSERAQTVREMIESRITLKEIIILDTRGISSMYASDGGVIVVV